MTQRIFSQLMSELKAGKFVFTGELEPEKTTDLSHIVKEVDDLKGYVVASNVTDNPQSCGYISSLAASYIIQKESGMEIIYQLRCADRNRLALTADLLGAGALDIKNILALTGDHTTLGDTPQAKPVFDLDSTQLVKMIRHMVDKGVDLNGIAIEHPPKFHVGGGANPNANPIEPELNKLVKKARAGAEFFQTQVVFEIDVIKSFLKQIRRLKVPTLIGVMPLKSFGVADFFDKNIPGVTVPKELMEKMAEAKKVDKPKRRDAYDQVNIDYFVPLVKEIKNTTSAAGVHIMSVGYPAIIPHLVSAIK